MHYQQQLFNAIRENNMKKINQLLNSQIIQQQHPMSETTQKNKKT